MQTTSLIKTLKCYGPETYLAYVTWVPSGSATQTITDAAGVSSVARTAAGSYTVTFAVKPKAIYKIDSSAIDNSVTDLNNLRIESFSATAGTATLKHVLGASNVHVPVRLTDVSSSSSAYTIAPVAGTVTKIYSALGGPITVGNAAITTAIGTPGDPPSFTSITNGGWTVAHTGSAAGTQDNATPTAANTVAAGDILRVTSDGGSTDAATLDVTFVITPTVGSDTADLLSAAFLLRMAS